VVVRCEGAGGGHHHMVVVERSLSLLWVGVEVVGDGVGWLEVGWGSLLLLWVRDQA
jgi:hypothetical protein